MNTVRRVLVLGGLGALLFTAAIPRAGQDGEELRVLSQPPASQSADPLACTLAHCNALATVALDHAGCKAAWAEKRHPSFAPHAHWAAPTPSAGAPPPPREQDWLRLTEQQPDGPLAGRPGSEAK